MMKGLPNTIDNKYTRLSDLQPLTTLHLMTVLFINNLFFEIKAICETTWSTLTV